MKDVCTQNMTIAARLVATLEREIVEQVLLPGSELDERVIAERFGASRTPVREALHKLAADGLVEVRPRRKAVVRKLDSRRLAQMFEVLAGLEGLAAEFAARRMRQDQVAELRTIHMQIEDVIENREGEGYDALNLAFHRTIYSGASNEYLCKQADLLRQRLSPYRRWLMQKMNRMRLSHEEHARILQAIADGDEKRAREEMMRHVRDDDRFLDFLITNNSTDQ